MSDQRNRKRGVHYGESLDTLLNNFPKPPGRDHAQLEVNGADLTQQMETQDPTAEEPKLQRVNSKNKGEIKK